MDPASIIALIGFASGLIDLATREAALAQQKGELTPEQLADIKSRAKLADDAWDSVVASLPPVK